MKVEPLNKENNRCSSGIGFETSLLLARNEFVTYATMRKLEEEY
jgi:hypothetical protein